MNKNIVVIGAGISGLTTSYLLSKNGFDVTIIEKNSSVGGSIESVFENGFLFDRGPNSALETTPVIGQLIKNLNLNMNFYMPASKQTKDIYFVITNFTHFQCLRKDC